MPASTPCCTTFVPCPFPSHPLVHCARAKVCSLPPHPSSHSGGPGEALSTCPQGPTLQADADHVILPSFPSLQSFPSVHTRLLLPKTQTRGRVDKNHQKLSYDPSARSSYCCLISPSLYAKALQELFSLPPSILLKNPSNPALVPLPTDPPEPSYWGSGDVQSLDTVLSLRFVLLVPPAGFDPAAHSLFSDAPSSLGCPNTTFAWFSSCSSVTPILLCSSPQLLNVTPTCGFYLLRTPSGLALFQSSQICVLETSLISLHPMSVFLPQSWHPASSSQLMRAPFSRWWLSNC